MKKLIITYGLISGTITAALMFITMPMLDNGTIKFENGELVGYTGMVIALAMVFFGIKSYRDNHANGVISFGKGFKIGILITLIASAMYGLAWEVTYHNLSPGFMQKMEDHYFDDMKADGATEEELKKAKDDWDAFSEYYKNPVIRFAVTLTEILPVGLIITLLSAAVLRKKEILPA